jgi:hypothetical protein
MNLGIIIIFDKEDVKKIDALLFKSFFNQTLRFV